MNLHLVVLIAYSVVLIALGLWVGRLVRGSADFFVAGRSLGPGSSPVTDPDPGPDGLVVPAPRPAQPTSFANGRYEVKRLLGEGGKKRVYLAQDTTLDREVAFALIKTEGLDDVSRTRITREA